MGLKRDTKFRLNNPRTFLLDQVQKARGWIYEKARSITSRAVEDLLKSTLSVPTLVCYSLLLSVVSNNQYTCRMHL
jgi:hypothetical protein